MAYKMKGPSLYADGAGAKGNVKVQKTNKSSKNDGRAKSSAFQRNMEGGSVEEEKLEGGRRYVETEGKDAGVVKNAAIVRLERNKPPVNSPNYASWQKAYDTAKSKQLDTYKKSKPGAPNYKKGYYGE